MEKQVISYVSLGILVSAEQMIAPFCGQAIALSLWVTGFDQK